MKRAASAFALFIAAALWVPAPAAAQQPVKSFDQLNTRLKAGDTVWVTDAQGREITGKIRDLSAASLILDAGGTPRDVQAAQVGTIRLQPKDSLKNGVLLGAVIGAALGVASCAANSECIEDEGGPGVSMALGILGAAAGAGIGAGIDAAVKGPKLVVYRAPGTAGQAPPSVSIGPVLTPRRGGVAVSFAF
jgi:hypothetical protein